MFLPRPKQQEVLSYRSGWMGVSAVPGSGKTTTLSYLAAQLVAEGNLDQDQEILIVTLVNSAVENFSHRVAGFVRERGLLPSLGYRVRTLHGLAHDIVRERPDIAGVSEQFDIIDEAASTEILRSVSQNWVQSHQEWIESLTKSDLRESVRRRVLRHDWPTLVQDIALAVIRSAKDQGLSHQALRNLLDAQTDSYPLLEMGYSVYREYQTAISYRGALDFDDLIVKAYQALSLDGDYLARLRHRWPFVLEDEAQDSSRLQEQILRALVGPDGNWVRVGDPNQAIFETFTTASPQYLRDFLSEDHVVSLSLPNSGRSTETIIGLANYLSDWVRSSHPVLELRSALTPPAIEPTPEDDPQPNPADHLGSVAFVDLLYRPDEELEKVLKSLQNFIRENPDATVAVLVPRNFRGFELVEMLKAAGVPYVEILQSTHRTRLLADSFADLLRHLAQPSDARYLPGAYSVWRWGPASEVDERDEKDEGLRAVRSCVTPEALIWPQPGSDWVQDQALSRDTREQLTAFRDAAQTWQEAAQLPADQLILTLASELISEPEQLALAYRFAVFARQFSSVEGGVPLVDIANELSRVAQNERRFFGSGEQGEGFAPDRYPGRVVVSTIHKAKGLEWDRVYLLSVNDYNFPSALDGDTFIAEKWFLGEPMNLQSEALEQLRLLLAGTIDQEYQPGKATRTARQEYAAERLRLLYVGITRARRDLILTWNTGRRGDRREAAAVTALRSGLEGTGELDG
ncbi:MAG: ATP-dependent helicase [Anaerolineales bacterium]